MINAKQLAQEQKEKEKSKYKIYNKIYNILEKKIISSSKCNYYYTVYEIPEFLIGHTLYNFDDCCNYLQTILKNNNFNVNFYKPNTLFISWENLD